MLLLPTATLLSLLPFTLAHGYHHHKDLPPLKSPNGDDLTLEQAWGNDFPFTGINTFAHLKHEKCLVNNGSVYDIAVIGVPFDTAVTYRGGARFGPRAIRAASQRQFALRGWNNRAGLNPYNNWAKVMDCGDIPVTPMDNGLALKQMTYGYNELYKRKTTINEIYKDDNVEIYPRIVSIGGDHSIILPALRAVHDKYGKVTLIHFDAHLDTWKAEGYSSSWHTDQEDFTHGTMLWMAQEEGLLHENSNFHVGLRTRLTDFQDLVDDTEQGFNRIYAEDVVEFGVDAIVKKIYSKIPKDAPVYLSIDIDTIDPGLAPGTGTPEVGGLLSRELIKLIRDLDDLNVVGADIVEVSPAYDHAEITAIAASQLGFELVTNMVKKGPIGVDKSTGKLVNLDKSKINYIPPRKDNLGDRASIFGNHPKLVNQIERLW